MTIVQSLSLVLVILVVLMSTVSLVSGKISSEKLLYISLWLLKLLFVNGPKV